MKQLLMFFLLFSLCVSFAEKPHEAPNDDVCIGAPPDAANVVSPIVLTTAFPYQNAFVGENSITFITDVFKNAFTGNGVNNAFLGTDVLQVEAQQNQQALLLLLRPNSSTSLTYSSALSTNPLATHDILRPSASYTADVQQINGLYVYLYSTPIDVTEFIGAVVSPPVVLSTDMDKMVQLMAKRAKAKYPDAEAIIFSNNDLGRCDAVKFK